MIGAVATIGLVQVTRFLLGDMVGASLLVFGIVLVVIVLWLPHGIHGALFGRRRRAARRPTARVAR